MRLRFRLAFTTLVSFFTLVIAFQVAIGQELCSALVTQALEAVGNNCGDLSRNNVCYGFNRVDATFTQAQPEDFFTIPADRVDIPVLQTIQTAPLSASNSLWGVAVMSLQANLPETLPGQSVIVLLLGDVTIENEAPVEEAEVTPIEVSAGGDVNVRSAPSLTANVVGGVTTGTVLVADRRSADGEWLRVVFNDAPAWINSRVVLPSGDVSTLPVLDDTTRAPMQAFYFRTGLGEADCAGAPPPSLVVQGPQRVNVNLSVNGVDLTLGSTIHFTQLAAGLVQISVIDGQVTLADGTVIPQGYTIFANTNPDTGAILLPMFDLRPMTPEEIAALEFLEGVPPEVLNYAIVMNPPDLTPPGPSNLGGGGSPQQPENPVVEIAGDCSTFAATSPLDGLANGPNTFYWEPVAEATAYRVNIFNENGSLVGSLLTPAPNTSVSGDISLPQYGTGFTFSWTVEAFIGEDVICTSSAGTMQRGAPPPTGDQTGIVDLGGDSGFEAPPVPTPGGANDNECCENGG